MRGQGQIISFQCLADVEVFVAMLNYARKTQETDKPIIGHFLNADGTLNILKMLDGPEWGSFKEERGLA